VISTLNHKTQINHRPIKTGTVFAALPGQASVPLSTFPRNGTAPAHRPFAGKARYPCLEKTHRLCGVIAYFVRVRRMRPGRCSATVSRPDVCFGDVMSRLIAGFSKKRRSWRTRDWPPTPWPRTEPTSIDKAVPGNQAQTVFQDDPFVDHVHGDKEQAQDHILGHFESSQYCTATDEKTGCSKFCENELIDNRPG
jgi:hypothetical protein